MSRATGPYVQSQRLFVDQNLCGSSASDQPDFLFGMFVHSFVRSVMEGPTVSKFQPSHFGERGISTGETMSNQAKIGLLERICKKIPSV